MGAECDAIPFYATRSYAFSYLAGCGHGHKSIALEATLNLPSLRSGR